MSGLYVFAAWLFLVSCVYSALVLSPFCETELCKLYRKLYLDPLSDDIKSLVIRIAFFAAKVYVSFRAVTLDSNITYKEKYAIVKVRDKLKTRDLYIPYRKRLRLTTRYEAKAYKGDDVIADLTSLPGIPLLVTAHELGADELAYCMPSSGKRVKRYEEHERPVSVVLDK